MAQTRRSEIESVCHAAGKIGIKTCLSKINTAQFVHIIKIPSSQHILDMSKKTKGPIALEGRGRRLKTISVRKCFYKHCWDKRTTAPVAVGVKGGGILKITKTTDICVE